MIIYETHEMIIVNKSTGKKTVQNVRKAKETRCDFSGKVIDHDSWPYASYELGYGSMDPIFGEGGNEYKFSEDFPNIDMHAFLSTPYVYYNDEFDTGINQEVEMLKAMMENGKFFTIEEAFRHFRVEAARKLIESGEIVPEDLE